MEQRSISTYFSIFLTVSGLLLASFGYSQMKTPVTDYIGIPRPIMFNNEQYDLVWSTETKKYYFKQEYIRKVDKLETFNKLFTIDLLIGDNDLRQLVSSKIAELDRLKQTNPVVNYQIFEKDDEIMLDFLLSQNSADGKQIKIIERNVYRYKQIMFEDNKKGVLLFAFSSRGYENKIEDFLNALKKNRSDALNHLGAFEISGIKNNK
jgi:hypothetical protein